MVNSFLISLFVSWITVFNCYSQTKKEQIEVLNSLVDSLKNVLVENNNKFSNELNAMNVKLNDALKNIKESESEIIELENEINKIDVLSHVKYDYVTCHNVLIHRNDTISKIKTEDHIYPIFHTNAQVWYSKIRQDWGNRKKVMWSRSGYTKPFYDNGVYGGTDMIYYVLVDDDISGKNLENNLNTKLMKYLFKTAKWSGFGNEKVFCALPNLPTDYAMSDLQMYELFNLTKEEQSYVENYMG